MLQSTNLNWASSYLPVRKSLGFISVLKLVFELQPLFIVVAVMKEFMDDLCSVNIPSLSSTEVYMED